MPKSKPIISAVFNFQADYCNISYISEAVKEFALHNMRNITLEKALDIKTAASEAIHNAADHAYNNKNIKSIISVRCKYMDNNSLEVIVIDNGCGILNLEQAMQPMYTTGGAHHSGMGFTIMDTFANKLIVESNAIKGTKVIMTFYCD